MGLATLGYVVLAAVAALSFIVLVYSWIRRRGHVARRALVALVVALVGVPLWGIFLAGLKDTLAEAIDDGKRAQTTIEQERLSAQILHTPLPKVRDEDKAKVAAMKSAIRSARTFGWDWKKLEPSWKKEAQSRPRPSSR